MELGGRILKCGLAPHLLSLLPVLEGGEVNPLVGGAGPIQVGQAVVHILPAAQSLNHIRLEGEM